MQDFGNGAILKYLGGFYFDYIFQIDAAGIDLLTFLKESGPAFARNGGRIQGGLAREELPIQRNFFSGPHLYLFSYFHFLGMYRNKFIFPKNQGHIGSYIQKCLYIPFRFVYGLMLE